MIVLALLDGRGIQSALEAAGEHASRIGSLWNLFLGVTAIVYVAVVAALLMALFRRRREGDTNERTVFTVVASAVAVTLVTLLVLLLASTLTGRAIAEIPSEAIVMEITARQWWWQVDYDHTDKSRRITTANEIVIPVGQPVHVRLRSSDVIHSFWVPNLHGKQDVIPGHRGAIVLQANRPGVYRGQCAEFCGLQHAKMVLWVNAVPEADFIRWAEAQRKASKIPSTPTQRKGQEVFMSSPCPLCHTIRGTDASGRTGPDLTHFASRRSIAAGTLPNRRGNLGGWILDPQHIKPGSYMPPNLLRQGELDPLFDYLESLQ